MAPVDEVGLRYVHQQGERRKVSENGGTGQSVSQSSTCSPHKDGGLAAVVSTERLDSMRRHRREGTGMFCVDGDGDDNVTAAGMLRWR